MESTPQDHRALAKGALVNTLGVFAKISRALFLVVFSRLLGSELFGLYMLAFAVQEVISKIAVMGLEQGGMRYASRLRAQGRETDIRSSIEKILIVCVIGSAVVAATMSFSAPWISELILGDNKLVSPLRNFAFGMPAVCATSVLLYSIRSTLKMQYEVYVRSVFEPFMILIVGTIALQVDLKVIGIVQAHNIAAFGALTIALLFFMRVFPRATRKKVSMDWKFLFHTSVPMGGMELLSMFKARLDLMVIGRFLPLSSVGIYGAVMEIGSTLRKTRSAFEPIFLPMSQMLHEKKEKKRFRENIALAIRWGLIASLAMIGPMILVPEAFLTVFGKAFEVGGLSLSIFASGQLFHVTLGLMEGVLAVTGFAYTTLINSLTLVGGNAVLLVWLVPEYGLVGAAIASAVSYVAVTLWRMMQAKSRLDAWPFSRAQLKPLISFAVSLTITMTLLYLIPPSSFVAQICFAVGYLLLYGGGILVLRLEPTDKDVLTVVRKRAKFRRRKT